MDHEDKRFEDTVKRLLGSAPKPHKGEKPKKPSPDAAKKKKPAK